MLATETDIEFYVAKSDVCGAQCKLDIWYEISNFFIIKSILKAGEVGQQL